MLVATVVYALPFLPEEFFRALKTTLLALGLYALALAILGYSQCREMVDIPLLVSANPEDLEALEKAVKRSGVSRGLQSP